MINKEYMTKPESSHDQAIAQGERNMEVTQGDPVCMVVHRTFTISEKICISDNDDRLLNDVDASNEAAVSILTLKDALSRMFPLSNFEIEYYGQDIDQLSAKEAGI